VVAAWLVGRRVANKKGQWVPPSLNIHALAVIVLIAASFYAFGRDRLAMQTTGFAVLLLLALGFYLFPFPGVRMEHFFRTFGHEALVTVCALFVLVKGLEVTGALAPLARLISLAWSRAPGVALPCTLALAAIASAFVYDTPLMAMLLPVVLGCSIRSGTSPSQTLLPLNYAVRIGGMATTIGTSTNLLAVSVAAGIGVEPIGMLDLAPPAIAAGGLGLLFIWLAAPRLLPRHAALMSDTAPRLFSAALHVGAGSFADGRSFGELAERTQGRLRVDRIQRGEGFVPASEALRLQAGDRMFLKDSRENLKEFEQLLGVTLYNAGDIEHPVGDDVPLASEGQQLAEVVITRASPLYQRLLNTGEFVATYQLMPLALHRGRATERVSSEAPAVRLRSGDVVLVQGSHEAVGRLRSSGTTLVLDGAVDLPRTERARWALLIFSAVVASHAAGLIPVSIGALMGVAAMLVTGSLRWRNITQALNINLIMVIVASLCLQLAMHRTGADALVAGLFVWLTQLLPGPLLLGCFMLLVTLLANLVTNNAAAVLSVPVGVSIAAQLELPPELFVLAIIYAANMGFVSASGYQTNRMVMGAGRYAPEDYHRLGIPLTALMLAAFTMALSLKYGL